MTFAEAVRKNLLDRETAAYHHNVDNEDIFVGDAIRRGFIKATIVQDPASLDIDPENKMVVEQVCILTYFSSLFQHMCTRSIVYETAFVLCTVDIDSKNCHIRKDDVLFE